MRSTERRLRALETAFSIKPPKPWRSVIVQPGETVEEVIAREGIGPEYDVLAHIIVKPGSAAAAVAVVAEAARLTANATMDVDLAARKSECEAADNA